MRCNLEISTRQQRCQPKGVGLSLMDSHIRWSALRANNSRLEMDSIC
ncbi:Protein of unknown function [Pyronema omphalodes CBS 100304]|uniref:Uncharacterized protein n=1 Tax=Pyronema omphalodes (strain CBS 100304) TaxID=1076935 RepID=U4LIM1_PYROM|nr:Protein of unknown function [Pyronema omphalodes CBS 100304]